MSSTKDHFCIAPYIQHHVDTLGHMTPCCINGEIMGDTSQSSLREIFEGEKFNNLRAQFLRNERPESCSTCWEIEDLGAVSLRIEHNAYFIKELAKIKSIAPFDGKLPYYKPLYLDIRASSLCNLRCNTCGSINSSSWAKLENKSLLRLKPSVFEQVKELIPQIRFYYFAGGEPLLMKENKEILDEILRVNSDMKVFYNSNLSHLKVGETDYLELWKKLKEVSIGVSFDEVGERAEYLREGTIFKNFSENISSLKREGIDFSFNTVLSVYNLFSLHEIIEFFEENYPEQFVSYVILITPGYFRLSALNKPLKDEARNYIKKLQQKNYSEIHSKMLERVLHELSINNEHEFPMMLSEIKRLDDLRGTDFSVSYSHHPLNEYLKRLR